MYGQEIVGSFTSPRVATVPRRHWETNGGGYLERGEGAAKGKIKRNTEREKRTRGITSGKRMSG